MCSVCHFYAHIHRYKHNKPVGSSFVTRRLWCTHTCMCIHHKYVPGLSCTQVCVCRYRIYTYGIYIHVYVRNCVCVCMYIDIWYLHTCLCKHIDVYTLHIDIRVHVYVCVLHTCTCLRVCVCVSYIHMWYLYTCLCKHLHLDMYICVRILHIARYRQITERKPINDNT